MGFGEGFGEGFGVGFGAGLGTGLGVAGAVVLVVVGACAVLVLVVGRVEGVEACDRVTGVVAGVLDGVVADGVVADGDAPPECVPAGSGDPPWQAARVRAAAVARATARSATLAGTGVPGTLVRRIALR